MPIFNETISKIKIKSLSSLLAKCNLIFTHSLPFIENASEYTVEYITDGINANKDARDYILKRENAAKKDWQIRMAQGGGFAIKLKKK